MLRQRFRHLIPVFMLIIFGAGLSVAYASLTPLMLGLYAVAGAFVMYFWLMALSDIHIRKHHESLDSAPIVDVQKELAEDMKKLEEEREQLVASAGAEMKKRVAEINEEKEK